MEQSDNIGLKKIKKIAREIIDYLILNPNTPRKKMTTLKAQIGKKYNFHKVIKNATILNYATSAEKDRLAPILKRRETRSISGVSVIAIMMSPQPCPGRCIYCPGINSQPGAKVAQSYTGREPAAMRSIYSNYDPYKQVQSRINDLEAIGHNVDIIHTR